MSFHCVSYIKLFPSNHLEVEEGGDGIFLYHKVSLKYYKESLKITQKMHNKCYNNLVANVVSEVKILQAARLFNRTSYPGQIASQV